MALHTQNDSEHLERVDLFATLVFLGALCCAVLGVKLKWFKAQLTLDQPETNTSSIQARGEVYRSIATDISTPTYRIIDESVYDKPTNIQISNPTLQSTTRDLKPKIPITLNPQSTSKTGVNLSDVTNIQNSSQNKLKTPSENKTNSELVISAKSNKEKEKEELKRQKEKEKEELKKQKEEEKRIKKEKEEKAKDKARTKAREKLKKEKEEKDKNGGKQKKEEKSKKEKEKKDKSSKPVASVTIDAEAVESTQRNLQNEITPFAKVNTREVQQTVDNQMRNARNKVQASQAQPDTGFSSSWDMVAAHRQNLQREVKTPMNNNLRSMSNQNKVTTPTNKVSTTPAYPLKSDRNGFIAQATINDNSDTEA